MSLSKASQSWRIPDELWEQIEPLLPSRKPHPLVHHRPRVDDRKAMVRFSIAYVQGASGRPWMRRGSAQAAALIDASRNGPKQASFKSSGSKDCSAMMSVKGSTGSGKRWIGGMGAMTKAPLGQQYTGPNPTDRAKRGVKRSLLVDGKGTPIGLAVEGANRNDFKMGRATLESLPIERPKPTPEKSEHLCLDKGYDYDEVRELGTLFGYTLHIRPRGEEAQAIKRQVGFKARRSLVERTHSWMNRFRSVADPLGQTGRELSGHAPSGLCLYHVPRCGPSGIGSKASL